jgi:hypothetical protein
MDEAFTLTNMFVSVLDAIQGDGFNPLWQEVQIAFNHPATCRQLASDTEILSAAAAGQVTLIPTDEMYRWLSLARSSDRHFKAAVASPIPITGHLRTPIGPTHRSTSMRSWAVRSARGGR